MSCNSPTTQQPDDGDSGQEAQAGQCQGEGEGVPRSASWVQGGRVRNQVILGKKFGLCHAMPCMQLVYLKIPMRDFPNALFLTVMLFKRSGGRGLMSSAWRNDMVGLGPH